MVNKLSYKLRHFNGLIAASMEAKQLEGDLEAALLELDALKAENEKACRALESAGFTLKEGAQEWKPPLGPSVSPLLNEIDSLRAELEAARKQEPIGWVNIKYGTYYRPNQLATTSRNDELIASGELIRVYPSPVPAQQLPDDGRYAFDPIYDKGQYYITGKDINAILKGGENER